MFRITKVSNNEFFRNLRITNVSNNEFFRNLRITNVSILLCAYFNIRSLALSLLRLFRLVHLCHTHNSFALFTHNSQLTSHNSQLTSHNSQLTSHNSQLTSHNSQLTSHNSQLPSTKKIHQIISDQKKDFWK